MIFPGLIELSDIGLFILRLVVGIIFLYHATPKLKNSRGMAAAMAMPGGMIFLLGVMEALFALGIIFGVLTQLAALLLGLIMVGAIFMKIGKWGVPFAAHDKTGWEFDLIILAATVAVLLTGGGSIGL